MIFPFPFTSCAIFKILCETTINSAFCLFCFFLHLIHSELVEICSVLQCIYFSFKILRSIFNLKSKTCFQIIDSEWTSNSDLIEFLNSLVSWNFYNKVVNWNKISSFETSWISVVTFPWWSEMGVYHFKFLTFELNFWIAKAEDLKRRITILKIQCWLWFAKWETCQHKFNEIERNTIKRRNGIEIKIFWRMALLLEKLGNVNRNSETY